MSVTDVTGTFPTPLKWPRLAMDLNKVDAIVIHHTAVDLRTGEGEGLLLPAAQMTVEDELNHIAVIHLYHKSRGFGGFGYHLIVFPSGRAYLVTPLTQWGAHVGGENDHLWGIAFAGDFTGRLPGQPQIAGGHEAVFYTGGDLPVNPHLAYGGTTCPGRLVEILDQLKEEPVALTEEQATMLKNINHWVQVEIPKQVEARHQAVLAASLYNYNLIKQVLENVRALRKEVGALPMGDGGAPVRVHGTFSGETDV